MAVAADGDLLGSIGGGIMEHKLVEKARILLKQGVSEISTMRQYHDKEHAVDQSGMICSGNQLIAFVPLNTEHLPLLHRIIENSESQCLVLSVDGLKVEPGPSGKIPGYYSEASDWKYTERLQNQPVVHIFGGGHVGLALSEVLHFLGFYIHIYDDRAGLNTLEQNRFAHEKHIISYEQAAETVRSAPNDYAAIMTMGYRQDKLLFQQLIRRDWYYLGMLGSEKKIRTLQQELAGEGIGPAYWEKIFAPIGAPVFSKTPQEIAISIAAEMIREKNKHFPTGRTDVRCEK